MCGLPFRLCHLKGENQRAAQLLINLVEEEIILEDMEEILITEGDVFGINTTENWPPEDLGEEIFKGNDKGFITSPADMDLREPVKLKDVEVNPVHRQVFEGLCQEYQDIFSKDSADLGKTPLMQMDIPTGDSPPVCQRHYTLALKHIQWVEEEIDTLEKTGIIAKSVSPWASPIVIVPKKTAPGEQPRRQMCVDYRMLNHLLPKVDKAFSKAKGVLTLVPLPKIDGSMQS